MVGLTHNHWIFGRGGHLEFRDHSAGPFVHPRTPMRTHEGCASICDLLGNLLFYTDGTDLWDANGTVRATGLGGSDTTAQSVTVLPPQIECDPYRLLCLARAADNRSQTLWYTDVHVTGQAITLVDGPHPGPNVVLTERLVASAKDDCSGYWLIVQRRYERDIEVWTSDMNGISPYSVQPLNYGTSLPSLRGRFRLSSQGRFLAMTNWPEIHVFSWDNTTAQISHVRSIPVQSTPFDAEFSPGERYLYYGEGTLSKLWRTDLFNPSSTRELVHDSFPGSGAVSYPSALQLAPNGRLYVGFFNSVNLPNFGEVQVPDGALPFNYREPCLDEFFTPIQLPVDPFQNWLNFPSFANISDACLIPKPKPTPEPDMDCKEIEDHVNTRLIDRVKADAHQLKYCDGNGPNYDPLDVDCRDVDLPKDFELQYHVTWGQSPSDRMETDDVEHLHLTICNPFKNVALHNLTVRMLTVTDDAGNPVAVLPDGTDSVQVTPDGPLCFGDLEPCTCVARAFVVETRGAKEGGYHLALQGVCFDVTLKQQHEACFSFELTPS